MDIARRVDAELDHALAHGPAKDITIPPCPELLVRLQEALASDDPDPAELARIASADVALAAGLLKTANSPLHARSRPAQTVEQAMAYLGLRPSGTVLGSFLVRRAISVPEGLMGRFWDTSTWRALACGFMARQLYRDLDPGEAHTYGLFCHVGMPILMQSVRGYGGTLAEAWARHDRSFTATENAAHQTDHAVVGALVARAWHLPRALTLAVRLHHDFDVLGRPATPTQVQQLIAMGLVAEQLVQNHMGLPELIEWRQHGPACLNLLQIGTDELDYWVDQLHPVFAASEL
jgi:HD-like signal output (HDOD) protein